MSNETLIQIPLNIGEDPGRLRIFLLRLIEKLDIVLGYRGEDGYVAQSELTSDLLSVTGSISDTQLTLSQLQAVVQQLVTEVAEELASLSDEVQTNTSNISTNTSNISTNTGKLADIQQGMSTADINYSAPTISAAYSQSEVQGLADQIQVNSDALDTLFAVLRAGGILS